MKKLEITGRVYQDINSNRQPIYLLEEDAPKAQTLETVLVNSDIFPTASIEGWIGTGYRREYHEKIKGRPVDFVETGKQNGNLTKEFLRRNIKKVKVTITVEEID